MAIKLLRLSQETLSTLMKYRNKGQQQVFVTHVNNGGKAIVGNVNGRVVIKSEVESLVLCGAKSKRTGLSCRQPAMRNGRCRLHGEKSTGPKTLEGLFKIKQSKTKHSY